MNSTVGIIIMVVLIVGMFWFTSRSNKKRQAEEQKMRDSLVVGDEVTTIGGIIGKVVSVKGDTFVLETTKDCTRIRFLKGAIRSIDVKVDDIAATVAESKTAEGGTEEAPAEEAPAPKKRIGGKKKAKAEDIIEEASAAEEAPVTEGEPNAEETK